MVAIHPLCHTQPHRCLRLTSVTQTQRDAKAIPPTKDRRASMHTLINETPDVIHIRRYSPFESFAATQHSLKVSMTGKKKNITQWG